MSFANGTTKTLLLLPALAIGLCGVGARAARAAQPVPPGTQVLLEFREEVSSKTAHKGDEVKMRVYTDVVVNGKTLIRQDAPATGIITDVKKPGIFGKKARLNIALKDVVDVSGRRVPLESYSSGHRFKGEGPGASGAGLLILGPVGLVGGAFIKGSNITIDRGTRIQATVAGANPNNSSSKKKFEQPPLEPKDP